MRVYHGIDEYDLGPCALAIGKFNGVHIGHQALLREVVRRAREADVRSVALTFDRHPRALLGGEHDLCRPDALGVPHPPELVEEGEKIRRIRALGLDAIIITQFTQELARTPANVYLEALCRALRPRTIVCGMDFRFGKGAKGDVALLRDNADRLGYALVVVPAVTLDGEVVSSSGVIRALHDEKLDRAMAMLNIAPEGRPRGTE